MFAANFHLFRGTPSWIWLNHVFSQVFGFTEFLDATTADAYFDRINAALATDAYRPPGPVRPLQHRDPGHHRGPAREVLRTTRRSAKAAGAAMSSPPTAPTRSSTSRTSAAPAPSKRFAEVSGQDVYSWKSYLEAHRLRRQAFIEAGATSSDHATATAATADLSDVEAEALFQDLVKGEVTPQKAELFRAQMLTEMAKMSLDDGLVMQIHPGSHRNHNLGLLNLARPRQGRRHPHAHRICRGAQAPADPLRQRPAPVDHPVHPGRDHLQPRAGPAGRPLSRAEAGSLLVVPRQPPRA
ncbi:glucuronate isomerase [Caulobacter segnis]